VVAAGRFAFVIGAVGVGLAAISAPTAAADPAAPADPVAAAPATAVPPADSGAAPVVDAAASPAADPAAALTPPDGVAHLPSPSSLPPGTTQQAPDHPTTGMLREVWNAIRNGEMTGPDALKLLATRPIDPQKLAASTPSNQGGPAVIPAPVTPEPAPAS
jgi:hypothetical protein